MITNTESLLVRRDALHGGFLGLLCADALSFCLRDFDEYTLRLEFPGGPDFLWPRFGATGEMSESLQMVMVCFRQILRDGGFCESAFRNDLKNWLDDTTRYLNFSLQMSISGSSSILSQDLTFLPLVFPLSVIFSPMGSKKGSQEVCKILEDFLNLSVSRESLRIISASLIWLLTEESRGFEVFFRFIIDFCEEIETSQEFLFQILGSREKEPEFHESMDDCARFFTEILRSIKNFSLEEGLKNMILRGGDFFIPVILLGGISGAFFEYNAIPSYWFKQLEDEPVESFSGQYDGFEPRDYSRILRGLEEILEIQGFSL